MEHVIKTHPAPNHTPRPTHPLHTYTLSILLKRASQKNKNRNVTHNNNPLLLLLLPLLLIIITMGLDLHFCDFFPLSECVCDSQVPGASLYTTHRGVVSAHTFLILWHCRIALSAGQSSPINAPPHPNPEVNSPSDHNTL